MTEANSFDGKVKVYFEEYLVDVLHCKNEDKGEDKKGKNHGHILDVKDQWKAFMYPPAADLELTGNRLKISPKIYPAGNQIKLHPAWKNLNSSQIMTLNYFLPYAADMQKLGSSGVLGANLTIAHDRQEFLI